MMKFKTRHYRHCLYFSRVLQTMKNCVHIIVFDNINMLKLKNIGITTRSSK